MIDPHKTFILAKHVTLLFSYGQSNELGNAANASIPAVYLESRSDVRSWQGSSFSALTPTTNTYPQIATTLHASEFSRGWNLCNVLSRDLYMLKYAEGGTSMYDYWKVGGSLYTAAKSELTTVINYVTNTLGYTYTLIGCMNQGEHDSADTTRSNAYAGLYAAHLYDLLSSFNFTAYLCTQTRSNLGVGYDYTAGVRAAQSQCVTNISNGTVTIPGFDGSMITIIDCSDLDAGNLHYTEPGYTTLGTRQANAITSLF